ncbi:MAG: hypothetical protein KGQ49_03500, partial [Verrucomicrobia bacterium]|nr:hypothetical protein [Verrucomicrobiota bacterium]
MRELLLSRITKDFLNLDPDVVPPRQRYRMGWSGSVLASQGGEPKKGAAAQLLAMRERFASLFDGIESKPIPLSTAPKLTPPVEPPPGSLAPPYYFSRGALDRKNLEPISYLLIETHELAKARPVPGNSLLFRSLCRGKGVLRKNGLGLVYLDIDNRFITMMLPYLRAQVLIRPPYFNL